ncbi:MAG: competence/damage-inducible protein A [Balneolales bacterium]
MFAQIITIGNELLIGDTINTNAAWMGRILTENGIKCEKVITIGDESAGIIDTLSQSLKEADITIMTGGLGPTHDDITKKCLLDHFKVNLIRHEQTLEYLQNIFKERNIPFLKSNFMQADIPENCEVMPNMAGTAPGMWFPEHKLAVLPGVPSEMKYLMKNEVIPRIKEIFPQVSGSYTRFFQLVGIGESTLNDISIDEASAYLNDKVSLAFLPHISGITLRINSLADTQKQAEKQVMDLEDYIRQKAGEFIYSDEKNVELNQVVGKLLTDKKLTLATAESCTGGFVASYITDVPGSGSYFKGGMTTYSNDLKIKLLNVPESTLNEFGAVSKPVALRMAKSTAKYLGSDIGVSTTGIAGPGGGTPDKPVGTVWIGYWSKKNHFAVKLHLHRSRMQNKERTTVITLDLIRRQLNGIKNLPYGLQAEYP